MYILSNQNSIANHFLSELRSTQVQKDSLRFRKNLERLGEIMAYEISKNLIYQSATIHTPLGVATTTLIIEQPVLAVVLRAGLPFYQGFLNFFDKAESAFIAAYRGVPDNEHQFDVKMDYLSTPGIENKTIILIDPMLATGKSLVKAYTSLLKFGMPKKVHVASVIASKEGASFIMDKIPSVEFWTGALDPEMNDKFYILPGLGDAGDLSFGCKI